MQKKKRPKKVQKSIKKDNDRRINSNVFYSLKSNQHNLCSHHQNNMGNVLFRSLFVLHFSFTYSRFIINGTSLWNRIWNAVELLCAICTHSLNVFWLINVYMRKRLYLVHSLSLSLSVYVFNYFILETRNVSLCFYNWMPNNKPEWEKVAFERIVFREANMA